MQGLREEGVDITAVEVSSYPELTKLLDETPATTLLWPNAYYVDRPEGGVAWIQDEIELRNLPYIGQDSATLRTLLHKGVTYQALEPSGVPTPTYVVIGRGEEHTLESKLMAANLHYPLAMKPTSESSSKGVKRITNTQEAQDQIQHIFEHYPHSEVIIEQWLPSDDLTCSYFELGNEVLLIPTYFNSTLMSGTHRVREWRLRGDGPGGINPNLAFPAVTDPDHLQQFKFALPAMVEHLNITSTTRVDCRQDEAGTLRFFDVNGMPGISFQISVVTRQTYACYPHLEQWEAYKLILNTVVMMAAERFRLEAPVSLQARTLFSLPSEPVVRFSRTPATIGA